MIVAHHLFCQWRFCKCVFIFSPWKTVRDDVSHFWDLSSYFSPLRYSGTGRAIWSLNSGIWSTTCCCPSCCCVYVPISTSTTSGKGRGAGEEEEQGKTWPWQTETRGRTSWKNQTNARHALTWRNFPPGLQQNWRFWDQNQQSLMVPVGIKNCQSCRCCTHTHTHTSQCRNHDVLTGDTALEDELWNRCVYMHMIIFSLALHNKIQFWRKTMSLLWARCDESSSDCRSYFCRNNVTFLSFLSQSHFEKTNSRSKLLY